MIVTTTVVDVEFSALENARLIASDFRSTVQLSNDQRPTKGDTALPVAICEAMIKAAEALEALDIVYYDELDSLARKLADEVEKKNKAE